MGRLKPLIPDFFRPFVPEAALDFVYRWFMGNGVSIRISRSRNSKLGDYRHAYRGQPPWISVNRNLNRYEFLLTLVHEMAHHEVVLHAERGKSQLSLFSIIQRKPKQEPKPHGKEWLEQYRQLMLPLLKPEVFPDDLLPLLLEYFRNIQESPKFSAKLTAALKRHDLPDGREFLENLPHDAVFTLIDGRTFRKKEKLRTRYRCICLDNNRTYFVNAMARVQAKVQSTKDQVQKIY